MPQNSEITQSNSCLSLEQLDMLACGQISEITAEQFRTHIAVCAACRELFKECQANAAYLREFKPGLKQKRVNSDSFQVATMPSGIEGLLDDDATEAHFSRPPVTGRQESISDSIPGYSIVREIHRGGQGVVYQAIQEATKRKVAIKVLLEGPFAGEQSKERFKREVKLIAALKHPNIVAIYDSGLAHDKYYYAMDYVRGLPLDEYVHFKALGIRDIIRLFGRICDAVGYAHRKGVIHRDLKPSNILVSDEGSPYIVDFGLAKVTDQMWKARPSLVSQSGHIMGTLRYMSPEQTSGNPDAIDTRTDVYSLGVVLYEILTEAVPYDTRTDMETALRNIRKTDPQRPSKIHKGIHADVDAIVLKAMAKEPERRYLSAGELKQDLDAWLEGRPVMARSASSLYILRKLAFKHGFHTTVVFTLLLSILAFGAISYEFYRREQAATDDLKRANFLLDQRYFQLQSDMQQTAESANRAVQGQVFGWFLAEWRAKHLDQAREIRVQAAALNPAYSAAMAFLLEEDYSLDRLRTEVGGQTPGLLEFVAGERELMAGRRDSARRFFDLCCGLPGAGWLKSAARARLNELVSEQPSAAVAKPSTQPSRGPTP